MSIWSRIFGKKSVSLEEAFVAIANDLLIQLEKQAKERGVSIETLVNLWIQERLIA